MLAITQEAATAIGGILSARDLPAGAGVRLSLESRESADEGRQAGVRLDVVEAPEAGDEVLEGAPVFIEPEAALILDDKLLDADISGEQVRFAVLQQT